MKKTYTLLFLFLLGMGAIAQTNSPVSVLRVDESVVQTNCYVLNPGGGEQTSGGSFQQDAILTYKGYQYTVYYNKTRNVCISRRKLPFGKWEEVVLAYKNSENDSHNVISMGICRNDGTIHLSYDHHNADLHYCYSVQGLANNPDAADWATASFSANTNIMDKAVPNVTYPRFISMPDGNLLFECRFRWSGYGDSYLRKYDGNTHQWSLLGRYVQGEDVTPDACAYINRMDYDCKGRLHVSWCWRDDYGGGSNHDLYYGYSDDNGLTWHDKTGTNTYTTQKMDPVEDHTTGTCMGQTKTPLMLKSIAYNRGYINQESQASDSKGRVHILNSYMNDDAGTDSNWSSSRGKCILHHHYVDTDGTLVHRYIYNNGNYVNSSRRSQIVIDSLDNAYVVANGVQVYAATAANNYTDWALVSDIDDGRFVSEVQIDHTALADGLLSFVYLTSDGKWTVIDYLIDNPKNLSGNGLKAEYFSNDDCTELMSVTNNVRVGEKNIPVGTKSIRYSGTFETKYAEPYTMYLGMSSPLSATVYIDDVKVMFSKESEETKEREYAFTFQPTVSHKHNIVIDVKAVSSDSLALLWSSTRTTKETVPLTALYAEKQNDENVPEALNPPDLKGKIALSAQLSDTFSILGSGKNVRSITPFNPTGNYSIEIKAKITAVEGRGLDIEARTKAGKGFRFSLNQTSIQNASNSLNPTSFALMDNSEYQTYRFAVSGDKVYVYCGKEYVGETNVAEIKDILENDTEAAMAYTEGEDVTGTWIGNDKPTAFGWSCSYSSLVWDINNGTAVGSVRFLDAYHAMEKGGTYDGQLLVLRWDVANAGCTFFYPVTLEANTNYDLAFLYEWWNNGSSPTLNVGISKSLAANSAYQSQGYTMNEKMRIKEGTFNFTTQEAGQYYITFEGTSGTMLAAGGFTLKSKKYTPVLRVGKNYQNGSLQASVEYITYEDEAYAAAYADTPDYKPNLEEKALLPQVLQGDTTLSSGIGKKSLCVFPLNPSDNYSVEISATVSDVVGRGLDVEMRDAVGKGFRTALSLDKYMFISPFSSAVEIETVNAEKQVMRYAVANDTVHIYRNLEYVTSFDLASIGDMNAAGTSEVAVSAAVDTTATLNKVQNPKFEATADNAAPANWISDHALGTSPNPRVQVANAEIPASTNANAAFMFRFDGNGGTYYAYPVQLAPNTVYVVSFDLIAWGGDNLNKSFAVVVSASANGAEGILASKNVLTPNVRATANNQTLRFRTPPSANTVDTYYLSFVKIADMGVTAVTNVFLGENQNSIAQLLFGKNYTTGKATIHIDYVRVDETGAYAPKAEILSIPDKNLDNEMKCIVTDNVLTIVSCNTINMLCIYDVVGRSYINICPQKSTFTTSLPQGIYLLRIKTSLKDTIQKVIIK